MWTRSRPELSKLWQQPRRSSTRRAVLQVHLWLGVLLGMYTVVIGLTGSALVFRPEIERAQRPRLFRHTGPATQEAFSLDQLCAAVRRQHPRSQLLGVDNLDRPSEPAIVYLSEPAPANNQRMVYVDQGSGAILGEALRYSGWLGTCANLHVYLMAGAVGYTVNGACALAFLGMCLTGWLLWWPGIGHLGRGLRVRSSSGGKRTNWKRLNWDLHAVGGFWSNPLLILVIATGILFVFPRPVLLGLAALTGHGAGSVKAWLAPPPVPGGSTLSGAAVSPDRALASATAHLGQADGYRVRYLALPQPGSDLYEAIAYRPGGADYAMPIHLYLNAHPSAQSGQLLGIADARALPAGLRWSTYAYAMHFGTFGGTASRVAWVLLGLVPAALWATGLLLWWNRTLRPALGRRRAAGEGVLSNADCGL